MLRRSDQESHAGHASGAALAEALAALALRTPSSVHQPTRIDILYHLAILDILTYGPLSTHLRHEGGVSDEHFARRPQPIRTSRRQPI